MRPNNPFLRERYYVWMRMNRPGLRVLYSCGCGRIAHVCVYAIRADADEQPVFARPLFLCLGSNNPRLRVLYSCGCGRVARIYDYAIRAYTDE